MKKYWIPILTVCLLFARCTKHDKPVNSQTEQTNETTNNVQDNTTDTSNDNIINFENVVLINDEYITMELLNFYTEEVISGSEKVTRYCITVNTTNKSDRHFFMNPADFFIDGQKLKTSILTDTIDLLKNGYSEKSVYSFAYDNPPTETPLNSVDELYKIEGYFFANVYDANNQNIELQYEPSITLSNAIGKNIN